MDIVKLSNDTVKQIIDAFTQQLLDGRQIGRAHV